MKKQGTKALLRLLALVLVLCAILGLMQSGAAAETTAVPACYEHGDVNGDGKVDARDAIRVLYHSLFADDPEYAVNQDCNFNGDERLNARDAIYLLYSTFDMFAEDYPLLGEVHRYYDPQWDWKADGTVAITFKCGCGESHTVPADKVEKGTEVTATCTTAGSRETVATVTFEGETYTDVKTEAIPPVGHSIADASVCEGGICSACETEVAGMGHAWEAQADKTVAATCTTPGTQGYKCANCGEEKTVTLEGLAAHAYAYVADKALEERCAWQKVYACACGAESTGETFYKHTYTAALTKEATCQAEGEKTFTCDGCGHSYTETVPVNDAHTWVQGATSEVGVTTFSCACGATKTALCAEGTEIQADASALQDSELKLSDVSLQLDEQTLDGLGQNIQVHVDTTSAENLAVDAETKAQIGENPVYDFDLSSDGTAVSQFAGSITITLPYTLQPGDDVDCIDVWFISDDGEVTCVQGTYANGFVTFSTNHFSYYTVTRLTPRQRCEHYGHVMNYGYKAPTCTADGFDLAVCQRCGYEEKNLVLPMVDHQFAGTRTEPTCDTAGFFEEICEVCKQKVSGELPALGHKWVLDEKNSVAATCQQAGKEVYTCGNENCTATYTKDLAQKDHTFEESKKDADCENKGHKKKKCVYCKFEYLESETAPTGHDFKAENAIWNWAEDHSAATVTLVCAYDKNHTKTLNAVVTTSLQGNETCGGVVTFTATASFNRATFTDSVQVDMTGKGHQAGADWLHDGKQHYHTCIVCQEKMDIAAHAWGEQVITKAPTCKESGAAKVTCTVCGYTSESAIPATAGHSYENGTCTLCGKTQNGCEHIKDVEHEVDVSGLGLCEGSRIYYWGCECGEEIYGLGYDLICSMVSQPVYKETLSDGTTYEVNVETCEDCGLTVEFAWYEVTEQETCLTRFYSLRRLKLNGVTIGEELLLEYEGMHAIRVDVSTVDAKTLGLCGGSFEVRSCTCGHRVITEELLDCDWVNDPNQDGVSTCSRCGTLRTAQVTVEKDPATCESVETDVITFTKDGKTLYTFTNVYEYTDHRYEVSDCRMEGKTCEDGVYITESCTGCGDSYTYHTDYHNMVLRTVTDLSGKGYCIDSITEESCACGQRHNHFMSGDESCSWQWIDEAPQTNTEIYKCSKCGLIRTRQETESAKDENCRVYIQRTFTYKAADGTVLATVKDSNWNTSHNAFGLVTLQEGARTCEDGVIVKQQCRDCSWTNEYTTHSHAAGLKGEYDLKTLGLCGGTLRLYECACGYDGWLETVDECCIWDYESSNRDSEVFICRECDTVRTQSWELVQLTACEFQAKVTLAYTQNDKQQLKLNWNNAYTDHREIYELTLLGSTCEDGYTVVERCIQCDHVSDWGEYRGGHGTWAVERERITDGQLCGEIDLITYSCACGAETHTDYEWIGGSCDLEHIHYDSAERTDVFTCRECGIEWYHRSDSAQGEHFCDMIYNDFFTVRKNGAELLGFQVQRAVKEHDYVYTYNLLGEDCSDGYTYTRECADCGERYTENEPQYSHNNRRIARYANEAEGTCGRVILHVYACACGEEGYMSTEDACSFEHMGYDSTTGMTTYRCAECGLEKVGSNRGREIEGTCDVEETYDFTFYRNGTELFRQTHTLTTRGHRYVASFEMLGDSCEDGYYVTYTCARCQKSRTEEGRHIGHDSFLTEYHDLSQYGTCGGEIRHESCPCGEYSSWYWNNDNCSWSSTGKTDPTTGVEEWYCALCDTYRYYLEDGSVNRDNCRYEGKFLVKLVRDGETLLDINGTDRWESHEMVVESFEMRGETCEDGYRVNEKCAFCDHRSDYSASGHYGRQIEFVDLKQLDDTLCGGYISYHKCPCGEYSDVNWNLECDYVSDNWSEEGEDGRNHSFWEKTCGDCGIRLMRESFNIYDQKNCINTYYYTYTLSKGDTVIKTYDTQHVTTQHTYGEKTVSLLAGSVTCEDGIRCVRTCEICGYEAVNTYTSHELGWADAIDLQPYGAICETELVEYACACGQYRDYELGGGMKCDMDERYTDHFIPGIIDTAQETTEGWVYSYSDSYLMTCAVTDPTPCAFKIRMSEYWLKEGCEVTEYQTWQLGYNPEDGTFLKEITIATGYSHAFHAYQQTTQRTDLADGGYVDTYLDTCADCGSTYREAYTYDGSGNQIRYEEEALNTLDNGENKRRFHCYEYGVAYKGYLYQTLERTEYTYADGSEYWNQYAYTYDFEKGCVRTTVYTNSKGSQNVWTDTCHNTTSSYETLKNSTCTQFGTEKHIETCLVCGQQTHECIRRYDPTAHYWSYDYEKEIYVCTICGLENINGASGAIVMEDMTDYEKGTDFVVGYWNRENVEVVRYVSVILDEVPADADNEILLTDISITELTEDADGINALTFSKADAEAAAAKAVADAGYTGTWHIRFTFVPKNTDDTLDYAITFEDPAV